METMPDEGAPSRDSRYIFGIAALTVFWLSGSIAGFFFSVGAGLAGMALCSLVVSYFLGSSA